MPWFHLDEKQRPLFCEDSDACPKTHFATAENAWLTAHDYTLPPKLRAAGETVRVHVPFAALPSYESAPFETLEAFANSSLSAHKALDELIEVRSTYMLKRFELYEAVPWDKETAKRLRRDYEWFKNTTARLVEAHTSSPHYQPKAQVKDLASVGGAHSITAYEANTLPWLDARYNSVGGSDVSKLAIMDFLPEKEIVFWDRKSIAKVESTKLARPTAEDLAADDWLKSGAKYGALYRGTVWEARARDRFIEAHPNLTVFDSHAQYANSRRPWQQVNFDGIISDRSDCKPTGILELKTGNNPHKWENGVPLAYRAQVLYYLNATELERAIVGVVLNDGLHKYFELKATDPVAPGYKGGELTMEEYIATRVEPWFMELKEKRAA